MGIIQNPINKVFKKSVFKRRAFFFLSDLLLFSGAMYFAFWCRFNGQIPANYIEAFPYYIFLALAFKMTFLVLYNLYDISWRYVSLDVLIKVFKAVSVGSLCMGVFIYLFRFSFPFESAAFPRSVVLVDYMFSLIFIGTFRAVKRLYYDGLQGTLEKKGENLKVLVIGAGSAGEQIVREMKRKRESSYVPCSGLQACAYTGILSVRGGKDQCLGNKGAGRVGRQIRNGEVYLYFYR